METKTNTRNGSGMRNRRPSGNGGANKTNKGNWSKFRKHNGSRGKTGGGNRGGNGGRGGSRGGRGGGRKMPSFDPSLFINTNPIELKEEVYVPKHKFSDFDLDEKLQNNIKALGILTPSPIQDQIISEILNNKDVIGLAETGTGKTAAFLIPIIQNTLKNPRRETLILAPTRELAIQIDEELRKLVRGFHIYSATCVGGMNIQPQIRALRRPNNFIIGTPGRIMDLIDRKCFKPQTVATVILDEADRMLDMGFVNDMRTILKETPASRETLLFSATTSESTNKIVHEFLRDPVTVSVKKKDVTDSIEQDIVSYVAHKKYETLVDLLIKPEFTRVLVFGAMKHSVEKLAKQLSKDGIDADSIHGNKSHIQRQRALQKFKDGKAQVLVATDVAARGIHVNDVSHVINYDLPGVFEDYVHRIGRTGRGNKKGKALTFVAEKIAHNNNSSKNRPNSFARNSGPRR